LSYQKNVKHIFPFLFNHLAYFTAFCVSFSTILLAVIVFLRVARLQVYKKKKESFYLDIFLCLFIFNCYNWIFNFSLFYFHFELIFKYFYIYIKKKNLWISI